jgi:hypothetical protein
MRAAVRDRYGPPDVVRIEDVDQPAPVDDQVLVRVAAASVNRGDLDGLYEPQFVRFFTGRAPRTRRIGIDRPASSGGGAGVAGVHRHHPSFGSFGTSGSRRDPGIPTG